MVIKLFHIISWLAIITGIALILLLTYWFNWPYKPLVFNGGDFPVVSKTVHQGGTLLYTSNYCKYTNLFATVSRSFANDLVFSTPVMTTDRATGCHEIVVAVAVPKELPPGVYHLENTYTYKVNPIREVQVKHSTQSFTVIGETK